MSTFDMLSASSPPLQRKASNSAPVLPSELTSAEFSCDFEYTPDVFPSQRQEDATKKFRFDELGQPSRKRKRGGSPMAVDAFEIEQVDHAPGPSGQADGYTAQWLQQYATLLSLY